MSYQIGTADLHVTLLGVRLTDAEHVTDDDSDYVVLEFKRAHQTYRLYANSPTLYQED